MRCKLLMKDFEHPIKKMIKGHEKRINKGKE